MAKILFEQLKQLYLDELLTDSEIGKILGKTDVAISYQRKKYGISTLSAKDRIQLNAKKNGLLDIDNVSKERLIELNNSFGMREVAKKFGCSKLLIKKKYDFYNIKSLSKTERTKLKFPYSLSQTQKDLIYGSLMGDGGIYSLNQITARFQESHCEQQKEYLEWKQQILMPFSTELFPNNKTLEDGRIMKGFGLRTITHSLFMEYRDLFYKENKILPNDFEEKVNGFILAIWFMDDGHRTGNQYTIANNLKDDELEKVKQILNKKFNLQVELKKRKDVTIIYFHNNEKFVELIGKYIHKSMEYKLALKDRLLEKEYLKDFNFRITTEQFEKLSNKEEYLNNAVDYWHIKGFPYFGREVEKELTKVQNAKPILKDLIKQGSSFGSSYCLKNFNNFWKVKRNGKKAPFDVFQNDLKNVLIKCLKYKGGITPAKLRTELQTYGGVHNFRPVLARDIINEYCVENGTILDPCSGFGGRLFGFHYSKAKEYIGVDANPETKKGLVHLSKKLKNVNLKNVNLKNIETKDVDINFAAFEDFETTKKVDLVFTSPPYFNKEFYGLDKKQSYIRYKTYEEWKQNFLFVLIGKSYEYLKKGGYFVINIANIKDKNIYYELEKDFYNYSIKKFKFIKIHKIEYKNFYTGKIKYEPIFVFQKH